MIFILLNKSNGFNSKTMNNIHDASYIDMNKLIKLLVRICEVPGLIWKIVHIHLYLMRLLIIICCLMLHSIIMKHKIWKTVLIRYANIG